jgi:hypothetical protein
MTGAYGYGCTAPRVEGGSTGRVGGEAREAAMETALLPVV